MERITVPCEDRATDDVVYKVSKADAAVPDAVVGDYVQVLNGLAAKCAEGGYDVGWRNDIIVDLTVAAYLLGVEPECVLDDFVYTDLIDCSDDDEDPYDRLARVLDYKPRYSWNWMIDAEWWRRVGEKAIEDGTYLPVRFELVG